MGNSRSSPWRAGAYPTLQTKFYIRSKATSLDFSAEFTWDYFLHRLVLQNSGCPCICDNCAHSSLRCKFDHIWPKNRSNMVKQPIIAHFWPHFFGQMAQPLLNFWVTLVKTLRIFWSFSVPNFIFFFTFCAMSSCPSSSLNQRPLVITPPSCFIAHAAMIPSSAM